MPRFWKCLIIAIRAITIALVKLYSYPLGYPIQVFMHFFIVHIHNVNELNDFHTDSQKISMFLSLV